jgi:hypothetical protein
MKLYLITLLTAICCYSATAQETAAPIQRSIRFDFIKGDSTRMSLNEEFNLIEDSCSQIYRYAHVSMQDKIFTGPFMDVSRANPKQLITQGTYSAEGLKEGLFIINYLNGSLQAKGNFKNGLFDGRWEVLYDTGKPFITFEAAGTDIKIIDVWDTKGIKTVSNGNGNYMVDAGYMYWKGKLLNGRPEGKWKSKKSADDTDLTAEVYKNGVFQKGVTPFAEYTDKARLALISPNIFTFVTTERFQISSVPCNGTKRKKIVNADYKGGITSFSQHIGDLVSEYLKSVDLSSYDDQLTLEGEINEMGGIVKLRSHNPFNNNLSQGLINKLRMLPNLEPATADGKPVKQNFTITFQFHNGIYRFSYRFLPIQ